MWCKLKLFVDVGDFRGEIAAKFAVRSEFLPKSDLVDYISKLRVGA